VVPCSPFLEHARTSATQSSPHVFHRIVKKWMKDYWQAWTLIAFDAQISSITCSQPNCNNSYYDIFPQKRVLSFSPKPIKKLCSSAIDIIRTSSRGLLVSYGDFF
jgi:hypothetical protein